MKFEYFGASHFLITTEKGVKIATDPFQYNIIVDADPRPPDWDTIRPTYTGEADVVTMSHDHGDHSYMYAIKGIPRFYNGGAPQEYKGVKFRSVATYHGDNRGINQFIGIEADGIRVWHTGDHGHVLTDKQVAQIGKVDILMTNWDDDPAEMTFEVLEIVINQLKPKVVIPMHHLKVDEFLTSRKGFVRLDSNEAEFKAGKLPSERQFVLFKSPLGGGPV